MDIKYKFAAVKQRKELYDSFKNEIDEYFEDLTRLKNDADELEKNRCEYNPKPNMDQIIEISESDPIVHNCLYFWRKGVFTFEESLIFMVQILVRSRNELMERNHKLIIEKIPDGIFWDDLSVDVKIGD